MMMTAGMELGKWSANEAVLLRDIAADNGEKVSVELEDVVSTLGLKWCPRSDEFLFVSSLAPMPQVITKRNILSDVAKLFDPLGWLAPVIITAKILLQDLWIEKLDWDTPLEGEISLRWQRFRESLKDVSKIRIPRWFGGPEVGAWTLHGFSDASKRAYAAAVYMVIPGKKATLIMAKTKVAPVKLEILPRLELCGAALLVKLTKQVLENMDTQPEQIHFWCDSKVVLDWLNSHPSRWQTFVANRVSEINSAFPEAVWHHVVSEDNAADCATRGLTPAQASTFELWWTGPAWLGSASSNWPASTDQALKKKEVDAYVAQEIREKVIKKEDTMLARLTKYSSFLKLTRVLGYCGRWLSRTRARRSNSASQMRPFLTLSELRWAKIACYKVIQREYYSTEISLMKQGKALPKRSNLRSLTPFIDREGIIRLGGRLQNSPLSFGERHPVILPGSCEIVRRLISGIHKLTLHGGVQLMLSQLHREYWITGARRIVVGLYRDCVKCARYRAQTGRQQMAPLPAERLIPQRPFASTGLDYAGPVSVLFSRGRGAKSTKGYVAIFVCLVVKAVHIEIVSDLTTDAFLAAYARIVARRGVCTRIYSDNATTFKKASTELARMFTEASDFYSTVTERLASRGTEWTFIPPRAPHFGGLWEAAVKSFKYHFKRIIGDTPMTFEELSTLAAQIEACLNSRPLCRQSDCPDDLVALTPGHFLVGSAYLIQLEKCEKDQRRSLNERWRLIVQLRNSFWVRWRKEVLNQLQQRNKWYDQHENFKIGDMVLVKDELSPPARWPLGLVTEVHPGKDGLVRVVTIKTASSQLMRPIVKLVKLPLDQDAQECINEDSA
ncbi:uncharacterized protein LOC111693641 [Trichogramma pretiosum]|uniref:uncharacterized protein LOC111693641 n=1 Tax=Trichogramma pretiosum TaxID=7493 RepID=UPI000C71C094|nr:uncharacterized protein LOC111693641 [Trichogramma pretiosum]